MDECLLLVGGGKMGGALLAGWLARGGPRDRVVVIEPGPPAEALRRTHGVTVHQRPEDIDPGFRPAVVVFAVKPQAMDQAAAPYGRFTGPETVFSDMRRTVPPGPLET